MNNMIASEDFKADFIWYCRELEKRLDPRDVGTPLHIYLADRMQHRAHSWLFVTLGGKSRDGMILR
jgi:hypothetical protein